MKKLLATVILASWTFTAQAETFICTNSKLAFNLLNLESATEPGRAVLVQNNLVVEQLKCASMDCGAFCMVCSSPNGYRMDIKHDVREDGSFSEYSISAVLSKNGEKLLDLSCGHVDPAITVHD